MISKVKVEEDGTTIMSEELIRLATGCIDPSTITELSLTHLKIRHVEALERCECLVTLDLSFNSIEKIDQDALAPLASTLLNLDLSFNLLESIDFLPGLLQLRVLKLQGNHIRALPALEALGQVGKFLLCLHLQGVCGSGLAPASGGLGDSGDTYLAANPVCSAVPRREYLDFILKHCPNLRCFDGHYFCKEDDDPDMKAVVVSEEIDFKAPLPAVWIPPSKVTNTIWETGRGQAAEQSLKAILADAKSTVERALAS